MAGVLSSLKRLVAFLVFIVILAASIIVLFGLFVAGPTNLPEFLEQLSDISIMFIFTAIVLVFLLRLKHLMTPHIGLQAATIFSYLSMGLTVLVVLFFVLGIYHVPLSTLLTSAGIISVTVGLIISTFVGGILSGALVFTTYRFKVGEEVMVNNMPGTVVDMTALVMRIRTDVGLITIPNSAIASGGVIITSMRRPEPLPESRLPYQIGDRVVTPYKNEAGTIKEITAFHTTVALDSGFEITFLNSAVLTGATPIAKISKPVPS